MSTYILKLIGLSLLVGELTDTLSWYFLYTLVLTESLEIIPSLITMSVLFYLFFLWSFVIVDFSDYLGSAFTCCC